MRTTTPVEKALAKLDRVVAADSKPPFSELLASLAERMSKEAEQALTEGKMPSQDIAGLLSMASQLQSCADGDLSAKEAFQTLKAFAEKKTPAPERKLEEIHTLDLNTVFAKIAEGSAAAIERIKDRAIETRAEIQQRLDIQATLRFKDIKEAEEEEFTEPDEIKLLREEPTSSEVSLPTDSSEEVPSWVTERRNSQFTEGRKI